MSILGTSARRHVLSPVERFSEALFGLIMTLSIAGTMSVAAGGTQDVRTMLISILGCNIAWGIIDGMFYILGSVSDRGREEALSELVRSTPDPEAARAALVEVLPATIASALQPEDVVAIQRRLVMIPEPIRRLVMTSADLWGSAAVCVLVVLSCVPLLIPFLFMNDPLPALRVSNAIAFAS